MRTFTDRQIATLRDALTDAIDYRQDGIEDCDDCEDDDADGPCEDHASDLARAAEYSVLHDLLTSPEEPT